MNLQRLFTRERTRGLVAVALAIGVSGVFKGAAFARESFIAARFGLSPVTDAYFALQQFPITLASYVYGAFALAFVPAYAKAQKSGGPRWLSGFVVWALLGGFMLTVVMIASGPVLIRALHMTESSDVRTTLSLLSFCFAPVVMTGFWAAICTAKGRNLWALSMSGFPYLFMTVALVALFAMGKLNNTSLPLSMTLGFLIVGLYSLVCVLRVTGLTDIRLMFWRDKEFKQFIRQLSASSVENLGFAGNQLLIVYFLSKTGTGYISGNSCAMRIAMLGYTLLGMPLSQLVQAKLCTATDAGRRAVFQHWIIVVGILMVVSSSLLILGRFPIIRLVYMHGKFQAAAVHLVATLLVPWIAYVAVTSLNALPARYLFIANRGASYLRNQMIAYVAANLIRYFVAGRLSVEWIIWCSVVAEGCSFLFSLSLCLTHELSKDLQAAPKFAVLTEIA